MCVTSLAGLLELTANVSTRANPGRLGELSVFPALQETSHERLNFHYFLQLGTGGIHCLPAIFARYVVIQTPPVGAVASGGRLWSVHIPGNTGPCLAFLVGELLAVSVLILIIAANLLVAH